MTIAVASTYRPCVTAGKPIASAARRQKRSRRSTAALGVESDAPTQRGARHPAARASASVQNHRSPLDSSILVWS